MIAMPHLRARLHIRAFLTWVGLPQFFVISFLTAIAPTGIFTATLLVMGFNILLYALIFAIDDASRRAAAFGPARGEGLQ